MSRSAAGEPIAIKAGNNVYTVLVVVATLINAIALAVLFLKYNTVFGEWPFTMQ